LKFATLRFIFTLFSVVLTGIIVEFFNKGESKDVQYQKDQ